MPHSKTPRKISIHPRLMPYTVLYTENNQILLYDNSFRLHPLIRIGRKSFDVVNWSPINVSLYFQLCAGNLAESRIMSRIKELFLKIPLAGNPSLTCYMKTFSAARPTFLYLSYTCFCPSELPGVISGNTYNILFYFNVTILTWNTVSKFQSLFWHKRPGIIPMGHP